MEAMPVKEKQMPPSPAAVKKRGNDVSTSVILRFDGIFNQDVKFPTSRVDEIVAFLNRSQDENQTTKSS